MTRKIIFFLFSIVLLMSCMSVVFAEPATVTNNGNTRVRAQYFKEGQYHNIYLNPGETQTLPGGVEKVKVMREIGEWAAPLPSGMILEVEVKIGDQSIGKSTWYGDKVFFDIPSEAPPSSTRAGASATTTDTLKPKVAVITPQPPAKNNTGLFFLQQWQFMALILLLILPVILALVRSFRLPGFRGGELDSGFRGRNLGFGLLAGLALGFWGFFGYRAFGDNTGLLPFLAQDLYTLPLFLLVFAGNLLGGSLPEILNIFPSPLVIILFWMILGGCLGSLVGSVRSPILHGLISVLALLPFLIFVQGGLLGQRAYAWQSGYREVLPIQEGAFASLLLIPLILIILFNYIKPYHGYINRGPSGESRRLISAGGCLIAIVSLLLGLSIGGFGLWAYPAYAQHSFLGPVLTGIVSLPLMLGIPLLDINLTVMGFWGVSCCGLGCALSQRSCWGNCVLCGAPPALIAFLILITGLLMGRDVFREMDSHIYEQVMDMDYGLPPERGDLPDEVLDAYAEMRARGFGDQFGNDHLHDHDDLGSDIKFDLGGNVQVGEYNDR